MKCDKCGYDWGDSGDSAHACGFYQTLKLEKEQEPVAMKFKIYKPTVPDPTRQDINNALLPWVYDQDRNSGFDASMWVTPVATLPPQRKPLTDEKISDAVREADFDWHYGWTLDDEEPNRFTKFARAIEAAHGIKGEA